MTDVPPLSAQRPRVVIADDHAHFRFALRAYLDSEGFDVVGEADDDESTLAAVAAARPDVALVDLKMPGATGADVLTRLRDASPGTRVIALTGSERDEDIAAAREAGVAGYVVKGAAAHDELIAAIRSLLA